MDDGGLLFGTFLTGVLAFALILGGAFGAFVLSLVGGLV